MKRYEVLLTLAAEKDLEELHDYVSTFDSPDKADRLLDRILDLVGDLASAPERGSVPRELQSVGILEYRQIMLASYRLIYRTVEDCVIIYVIADGRRDFQTLLAGRLLSS